jgi:hypothetical protein
LVLEKLQSEAGLSAWSIMEHDDSMSFAYYDGRLEFEKTKAQLVVVLMLQDYQHYLFCSENNSFSLRAP